MAKGWLIAAPHSGAGKTTVTLGLLRALSARGIAVTPFKSGPDYIDPGFHARAAGTVSRNLDAWAMGRDRLESLVSQAGGVVIVEAAMGLFDGGADGSGSAAELAKTLDLDIVLVVDCARQSHSIAALVHGFRTYDPALRFAGVILNRVGSARHERMLRTALADVPVLGAIHRDMGLALPERHLGLVQAAEQNGLDAFLDRAAEAVAASVDLSIFVPSPREHGAYIALKPLGQRIAVARDAAFAFAYPHMLDDWESAGAEVMTFSPLANEGPDANADAIFLPGGYPELHAGDIASAETFSSGMRNAAARGATIYGECGGYMVLGKGMTNADGTRHPMLGLLPVETSFAKRKMHLGYRRMKVREGEFMGYKSLNGHEFHYCTGAAAGGEPLFDAEDALGEKLGEVGSRVGRVAGSWLHVIDGADR